MYFKEIIKKLLPLGIAAMCAFTGSAQENWDGSTPGQITYTNGEVGIGTTNPQYELQIAATKGTQPQIAVAANSVGNYFYGMGGYNPDGVVNSDEGLAFWGGTENNKPAEQDADSGVLPHLFIKRNTGYIGIGNTKPTAHLDIQGSGGFGALIRTTNTDTGRTWQFGATASNFFTIAQPGVGDWFTVQQDTGKVGIGTSTPSARLDINGNMRTTAISLSAADTGWRNQLRFESADKTLQHLFYQDMSNGNRLVLNMDYYDDPAVSDLFYLYGSMRVDENVFFNKNVGIGVENPLYELQISSSTADQSQIALAANSAGNFFYGLGTYNPDGIVNNDEGLAFWGGTENNRPAQNDLDGGILPHLFIKRTTGRVGIGTTKPGAGLDIKGSGMNSLIRSTNTATEKTWQFGATTSNFFTIAQPGVGDWLIIQQDTGNIGLGTLSPDHKLDVNGEIRAKEIIVETGWADYVFEDDYELAPLAEVKDYIKENGHLPNVPSAETISENGLSVAEMNTKMMEKIEELTLYIIAQEERINELESKLEK